MTALRIQGERDYRSYLVRALWRWNEFAYVKFGLTGLQAEIEFPSDWHERPQGWVRLGLGLFKVCFAFPWPWTVPDHYQCSGPTYGFQFCEDLLWLHYGKSKGKRDDPTITIYMPWHWEHREHTVLSDKEEHPYRYFLRSGEVQIRTATINAESRRWTRWWLPREKVHKSINVMFDAEVGERTGSWKGGCIGCGYEMKPGETPLQTLRRMERERTFD